MEFKYPGDWNEIIDYIDSGKGEQIFISAGPGMYVIMENEIAPVNWALERRGSLYRVEYVGPRHGLSRVYIFSIREVDLRDLCGV